MDELSPLLVFCVRIFLALCLLPVFFSLHIATYVLCEPVGHLLERPLSSPTARSLTVTSSLSFLPVLRALLPRCFVSTSTEKATRTTQNQIAQAGRFREYSRHSTSLYGIYVSLVTCIALMTIWNPIDFIAQSVFSSPVSST